MTQGDKKILRGRPKTLNRDDFLNVAMMSYWSEGPTALAIAEICKRACVSKPSVYREFGNDDGLKASALEHYYQNALKLYYEVLDRDQSFDKTLDAIIQFTVQDRDVLGVPTGCLFVEMSDRKAELGELTLAALRDVQTATLRSYAQCIERAKMNGQFNLDIHPMSAAKYFDAQNRSAMKMQKDGVQKDQIVEFLELAFLPFRQKST